MLPNHSDSIYVACFTSQLVSSPHLDAERVWSAALVNVEWLIIPRPGEEYFWSTHEGRNLLFLISTAQILVCMVKKKTILFAASHYLVASVSFSLRVCMHMCLCPCICACVHAYVRLTLHADNIFLQMHKGFMTSRLASRTVSLSYMLTYSCVLARSDKATLSVFPVEVAGCHLPCISRLISL